MNDRVQERRGEDRRKRDDPNYQGEERRKGDRRAAEPDKAKPT